MKKAYAIQLSYNVSDNEKNVAEKALLYFSDAEKKLEIASSHLDNDLILKARNNTDKAIENFNLFKISSFKCVDIMQYFASDTQSVKLLKSFITQIENLEKEVNLFADLFKKIDSNEFVSLVITNIDSIKNKCEELSELINQRIKDHLQTNILAKSWVNSVSNQLQKTVEKKKPLILDLYNKMQDDLNEDKK